MKDFRVLLSPDFPMNQNDANLTGGKDTAQVVRSQSQRPPALTTVKSSSRQETVKPWRWCSCILPASGGDELSSPRVSYYLSLEMQPDIAPFETLFLKQCVAVLL